jgi:selenide,water dikinase
LTTALKRGVPSDRFPDFAAQFDTAVASMTTLNAAPVHALRSLGDGVVHACTDITGFSLLGHAWEMASQSGVSLRFALSRIPWLPGVRDYAAAGYTPEGTGRNAHAITPHVTFAEGVNDVDKLLLFDPQTSGGLFVAVAGDDAERTLAALAADGVAGYVVARAEAPTDGAVHLYVDIDMGMGMGMDAAECATDGSGA